MPEEWLTLTEAADLLGISSWTARRWVREGRLQAEVRAGAYGPQYYVHAAQVEAIRRARQEPLPGEDGRGPATPGRAPNGRRAAPAPPSPAADAAAEFRRFVAEQEARWRAVQEELARLRREVEDLRRAAGAPSEEWRNGPRRRRWLW